jgi:hypothetical protein
MAVFWVVAPCSLVDVYQRFRGPCCLHRQGDLPSSYSPPWEPQILLIKGLFFFSCLQTSLSFSYLVLPHVHQNGEEYKLWSSQLCSFLEPPITSSLLDSSILLSCSQAPSKCSSLNVRDQVSRIQKTLVKIIVLYNLFFSCLYSRWEDKRHRSVC